MPGMGPSTRPVAALGLAGGGRNPGAGPAGHVAAMSPQSGPLADVASSGCGAGDYLSLNATLVRYVCGCLGSQAAQTCRRGCPAGPTGLPTIPTGGSA